MSGHEAAHRVRDLSQDLDAAVGEGSHRPWFLCSGTRKAAVPPINPPTARLRFPPLGPLNRAMPSSSLLQRLLVSLLTCLF